VHAQRRDPTGPRREASDRVKLRYGHGIEIVGWTLNVSRGGARLVVEERLKPGQMAQLRVNDSDVPRPIRVVWVRDEAGGQIIGVQFMDCEGTIPPFDDHEDAK
jgi:hypothetical protein